MRLLLHLGVNAQMVWRSSFKDPPNPPFLLTDSSSSQVLYDGRVRLSHVSDVLKHRLAGSDWRFAACHFGGLVGVFENDGGSFDSKRAVIFGEPSDCLAGAMLMRDAIDSDEVLAEIEIE